MRRLTKPQQRAVRRVHLRAADRVRAALGQRLVDESPVVEFTNGPNGLWLYQQFDTQDMTFTVHVRGNRKNVD